MNDFEKWNHEKQRVQSRNAPKYWHEREIWIAHTGYNIGVEMYGKGHGFVRPILILQKYSRHQFFGVPLTSAEPPEHVSIALKGISFLNHDGWLLFSQARCYDSRRLHRRLGRLPGKLFSDIKKSAGKKIFPASGA